MAHQENLYPEFTAVSKSEWLAKIEKDLKGRDYQELHWPITDSIVLPPVFHPEDQQEEISAAPTNNRWEIGEQIHVEKTGDANALALDALQKGANALQFSWTDQSDPIDLEHLLKDIIPEYVSLHFALSSTQSLQTFWTQLQTVLPVERLAKGSLYQLPEAPQEVLLQVLKDNQQQNQHFQLLQIHIEDLEDPVQSLTQGLLKASHYLSIFSEQGLPLSYLASNLQFSIACGSTYFLEIARIRALRILIANLIEAYEIEVPNIPIQATTSTKAYQEDPNTNMIIASSIAMSAVIGGVDQLFVAPANSHQEAPTPFTRRVARNLQHILQMESYMDRVADPAAGSYYLDHLTRVLVERSWAQFGAQAS